MLDALIFNLKRRSQLKSAVLIQRAALTLSAPVAPSDLRKVAAQLARGVPATLRASRLTFPHVHFSRLARFVLCPHSALPDASFDESALTQKKPKTKKNTV